MFKGAEYIWFLWDLYGVSIPKNMQIVFWFIIKAWDCSWRRGKLYFCVQIVAKATTGIKVSGFF